MPPPRPTHDAGLALTESTFCILAALTEPRHGYAIMQWVAAATEQRVKLGPGTLYGALTSLQERGFIVPAGEGHEEGERRKVYALTPAGRALLEGEVARLEATAHIGRQALSR
jgi:DNA-binding PadR family transcriptional regulator